LERYVIRGGRRGYERLGLLHRARWPETSELLRLAGVRTGGECLDVGCGGGGVTLELARLVGPEGRVTGLDMDEVKLGLAREEAAAQGLANIEFRVADVNEWQEVDAYDLVYSRFLLQHLSRPVDLLRRMWEAVRDGGVLAVEDADFDGLFSDPPNAGFEFYARMLPAVLARHGGDATTGRKLYRYALEAGIPGPELRLRQGHGITGDTKLLAVSTLDAIADAILSDGLATRDELDAAIADLAAFTEEPDTLIGDPRTFQIWARRPPA
jgi:ubiquinone/menaquinone biosynthesis C-methylase UbiE